MKVSYYSLTVTHDIYFSFLFTKMYTDWFPCIPRRRCDGLQCDSLYNSRQQQIVVFDTNHIQYITDFDHDTILFGIPYLQLSRTTNEC